MENQNQQQDTTQAPELGQTLEEIGTIGRVWADHGLRIGAAALKTSAVTLSHTANVLVSLAAGLSRGEDDSSTKIP